MTWDMIGDIVQGVSDECVLLFESQRPDTIIEDSYPSSWNCDAISFDVYGCSVSLARKDGLWEYSISSPDDSHSMQPESFASKAAAIADASRTADEWRKLYPKITEGVS